MVSCGLRNVLMNSAIPGANDTNTMNIPKNMLEDDDLAQKVKIRSVQHQKFSHVNPPPLIAVLRPLLVSINAPHRRFETETGSNILC